MGVQALKRSLDAARCRHPLIVMITVDTLTQAALAALYAEGCEVIPVERYSPAGLDTSSYKLQAYGECWCKLRMWELEEYSRLVYLDADMLVIQNLDALFHLPPGFWAAPDCAAGRPTQAERNACALLHADKCGRPSYFNAGMFVMTPSVKELARIEAALEAGELIIGGYAEQDALNCFYSNVWQPLPHTFNLQKGIKHHHPELWCPFDSAVIHYTDKKPWQGRDGENSAYVDIVDLWWRVYLATAC